MYVQINFSWGCNQTIIVLFSARRFLTLEDRTHCMRLEKHSLAYFFEPNLKFTNNILLLWCTLILSYSLMECGDFYHFFPTLPFLVCLSPFLLLCWKNIRKLDPSTHMEALNSKLVRVSNSPNKVWYSSTKLNFLCT